jgi:hypothetical protein
MTRCYWWGVPFVSNFGDVMSAAVLNHFAGVDVEWSEPAQAEIVVSGSVLDVLPDGWSGVVAGAGTLLNGTRRDLTKATVLAVRGHLTLRQLTLGDGVAPVIGDPGLLASELVAVDRGRYELGVVPHWSDMTLWDRFKRLNPLPIPSTGDPLEVIRLIGSCKKIVTSSLHGAIVADSFGIPRRVERFPGMVTSPKEGGEHKFHDYASSLGQPIEWCKHGGQVAPPERVEQIQADLFTALGKIKGLVDV